MRLLTSLLLPFAALAYTPPVPMGPTDLSAATIPTQREAALRARLLLRASSTGVLSSTFPHNASTPIGLMDYFADCSPDGIPTLLGFSIATNFKNALAGSKLSLSVATRHPSAAAPRMAVIGELKRLEDDGEKSAAERCFVRRHRDARWWTPGRGPHETWWAKLDVEKVYWVGGFGNVAYIGWIPGDLWRNITLPGHGGAGGMDASELEEEL